MIDDFDTQVQIDEYANDEYAWFYEMDCTNPYEIR